MNLTRDENMILLSGEPVEDWYASRGIKALLAAYCLPNQCMMCLTAAMSFDKWTKPEGSLTNQLMAFRNTYTKVAGFARLELIPALASIGELDPIQLAFVEKGYSLYKGIVPGSNEFYDLGYDAHLQLFGDAYLKQGKVQYDIPIN